MQKRTPGFKRAAKTAVLLATLGLIAGCGTSLTPKIGVGIGGGSGGNWFSGVGLGLEMPFATKDTKQRAAEHFEVPAALLKAAQDGDVQSMLDVGELYERMDEAATARLWYEKATALDSPLAAYHLGAQMLRGKPEPDAVKRGLELLEQASAKGVTEATYELACIYGKGRLVEKSAQRALELMTISANRGYPLAAFALGKAYTHGEGAPKDEVLGRFWLDKACEDKIEEACHEH